MLADSNRALGVPSGAAVKVVFAVVLVAGGGLAAAQLGVLPSLDGGDSDALSRVPDGVDSVTRVDPAALQDDGLNRLYVDARAGALDRMEAQANETTVEEPRDEEPRVERPDYESLVPANLTAASEEIENATGLDPAAAEEIVAYRKQRQNFTEPEYSGTVVTADWNESAVVAYARNQTSRELRNTTVNGTTVYRPEPRDEDEMRFATSEGWLAVLEDGVYVFGTEPAVRDAIAVANGNQSSVDGALADAFRSTRDGYVQFAQRSQNVNLTALEPANEQTGLNLTKYGEEYNSVHVTSGAYYTTDSGVGSVTTLRTNTTSAARDVESIYSGLIAIQAGAIQNETIEEELRSIEVERDDQRVTVRQETSYEAVETILDWYLSLYADGASSSDPAATPLV